MILLAVSMITFIMLYHILARFEFQFMYLLHLIISVAWQAWHRNSNMNQPPKYQEMCFFPLCMTSRKTFQELMHSVMNYKKTTPQLLEHIGLQNMKVGGKTNLSDLPLFVWCLLTLALKVFFRLVCDNMSSHNLPSVVHYRFPTISFHDYLHYCGILLARF